MSRYLPNLALFGHLVLDVTANCICEIRCLAIDGFDLNTVHKQSSKVKKFQRSWDLNLGEKQECFLCAMQPHYIFLILIVWF